MVTHETVREMTSGQLRDIIATMVSAIPAMSFDDAQRGVIGDKGSFVADIREVFEKRRNRTAKTFSITCEGIKASELVKRGKYDWVNDSITDKLFPIEKHTPVSRVIELVKFNHNPTSEEVLAEFERLGLERPTCEDAFIFGIAYPEEQRKHPVVFLHETVRVGGGRCVLVLRERDHGRDLDLHWFDRGWRRFCVFAAARK